MPEDDDQRNALKRLLDQLSVVSQVLRAMLLADSATPGQASDARTPDSGNLTSPVLAPGSVRGRLYRVRRGIAAVFLSQQSRPGSKGSGVQDQRSRRELRQPRVGRK